MNRRRKARELLVQALYASEVGDKNLAESIDEQIERRGPSEDPVLYVHRVGNELVAHADQFDGRIDGALKGWSPERVAIVERCILRVALCEFLYIPETPPKVALNEALELAKTFSTDDAARFVNGVLDRLMKESIEGAGEGQGEASPD